MELLVTFLAGISMAVGAIFAKFAKNPDRLSHVSLSLALGALVALVLFDLGPESLELVQDVGVVWPLVLVVVGAGVLGALELFIPDHDSDRADEPSAHEGPGETAAVHIGLMTVLALVLHNLVEGMTMYALALDDFSSGVIYALGVALHNIPMGMLIFAALRGERRSIKVLALSGALLSTVVGGLAMMLLSSVITETVMRMLTCVALGMILYIVLAELVPHVLRERPAWIGAVGTIVGFALVLVASLFE